MTLAELIAAKRAEVSAAITARQAAQDSLLALRSDPNLTVEAVTDATARRDAADATVTRLTAELDQLEAEAKRDADLAALNERVQSTGTRTPAYDQVARVGAEPRTYTRESARRDRVSFFGDAYRAGHGTDFQARDRLTRHMAEVAVEREAPGSQSRAVTTTGLAGLVVPQYLTEEAALVLRFGRPLANIVNRLPLPAEGMSIVVPRATTGASAAIQASENTAVSSTDQVWSNLTVPVVTIAGQQDVSRQGLERGAIDDTLIYLDLIKAYNPALDMQLISGTGSSGQALGIYNTAGIIQATAYAAAVTAPTFYLKTAGLVASVAAAGTATQPDAWVMHPRRWYWLNGQVDSSNRPLAIPSTNGVFNTMAVNTFAGGASSDNDADPSVPVGVFHGLPVYTDANVQTSAGSGPEDIVYLLDRSQAYLWEDNGGVPRQLRFEQTLGSQLTVKLVIYNYVAFTAGRYPGAFGVAGGNSALGFGQVAPTF